MKKIAIIMPHVTGKGGQENVVKMVMEELQKREYQFEPILYILGGTEDHSWLNNVRYTETSYSNNRLIRNVQNVWTIHFHLYNFLKKEKPDTVIVTHSYLSYLVNRIRKMTNMDYSIVSWIHFSLNAKSVKKKLLLYADYHLAISSGIEKQFLLLGVEKEKVRTIYNPVERSDEMIERPTGQTVFLYVGRIEFEELKRFKDLLTGLANIQGNWRLDVIGDGIGADKCKAYAEQLHIANRIVWHGWIKEPWSYIKEATALVLTSASEGFGMVLAEGIARGVYCISSDCETGPSDIIRTGENGILYPPLDTDNLAIILQEVVNGKSLPEQSDMKYTLNKMYADRYYENFVQAIIHFDVQKQEERNRLAANY